MESPEIKKLPPTLIFAPAASDTIPSTTKNLWFKARSPVTFHVSVPYDCSIILLTSADVLLSVKLAQVRVRERLAPF